MTVTLNRDCQFPHSEPTPATYDAKTYRGPWAYVCNDHLKEYCVPNLSLRTELVREIELPDPITFQEFVNRDDRLRLELDEPRHSMIYLRAAYRAEFGVPAGPQINITREAIEEAAS